MAFVDEFGKLLEVLGLATYEPGAGGDVFIEHMPNLPDSAIYVHGTAGPQSDSKLGYDSIGVQLIVRGGVDPVPVADRARAIYSALHGRRNFSLPDGTVVVWCLASQSDPIPMGQDVNDRHEYSLNFQCETRAVTAHRE